MNTIISFNRIVLLMKRFFIENKQRQLISWLISTIVFMMLANPQAVVIFVTISGFIFASKLFNSFSLVPNGIHYLTIPATHLEKLITAFLLSTFYFFAMMIATSIIGNFLGHLVTNILPHELIDLRFNYGFADNILLVRFVKVWYWFAISQVVFTLGALYFKRAAIGKTILSIVLVIAFFVVLEVIFAKLMFEPLNIHENVHVTFNPMDFEMENIGFKIVVYSLEALIIPFLWVVSYFRLTEKQV